MKTLLTRMIAVLSMVAIANCAHAGMAYDSAAEPAYADGWDNGDNGGSGFGPWSLAFDGDATALNPIFGSDPHFIDGVGVGPLGAALLDDPSFGLTTDGSLSASAEAARSFSTPLQVGDTFSVEIDGSALEGQARIGNIFELLGADGVPRYTLRTSLGSTNDHWILNGSDSAIEASDAFRVSVTLTGPDSYSGSVSSLTTATGTFSLNSPLSGTVGEPIVGLRIATSGTGSSANGARELFFDKLSVSSRVPEPSTWLLGAAGMALFGCYRRVRFSRANSA
ncbi:PEP-CTERM sorting domain-containing protein [Aeoliella sp.]|uniref:PEP-CTERM sorting domain-containing protein n=1 Tax=Aeoliella sp. TaxID=2795800 RepID=UPI003CCBAB39